jgi:hypothetical protein
MIAGNGFEPLAGRPPDRRAGFSHATARLRLGNRSLCGRQLEGPLANVGPALISHCSGCTVAGCLDYGCSGLEIVNAEQALHVKVAAEPGIL